MLIVNDSNPGEDDTARYFVNEKPPSFGWGHTSAVTNLLSCSGNGAGGRAGRGAAGGGEQVTIAGWGGQGGGLQAAQSSAPSPPPSELAKPNLTLFLNQGLKD